MCYVKGGETIAEMYDPSIFDNLKTVTEGALYDLDREGEIRINGRQDLIDLAAMGRTFRLTFTLPEEHIHTCEVELSSQLHDFAAELAKLRLVEAVAPGCHLLLRFRFEELQATQRNMQDVEGALNNRWPQVKRIAHTVVSSHFIQKDQVESKPVYIVEMQFVNKIDEEQIDDLEAFITHAAGTFRKLKDLLKA